MEEVTRTHVCRIYICTRLGRDVMHGIEYAIVYDYRSDILMKQRIQLKFFKNLYFAYWTTTMPIIDYWTGPKGTFFVKAVLSVQIVSESGAGWYT